MYVHVMNKQNQNSKMGPAAAKDDTSHCFLFLFCCCFCVHLFCNNYDQCYFIIINFIIQTQKKKIKIKNKQKKMHFGGDEMPVVLVLHVLVYIHVRM